VCFALAAPGSAGPATAASLYLPLEGPVAADVERMAILSRMPCLIGPYPADLVRLYNEKIRVSHPELYTRIVRELDRREASRWRRQRVLLEAARGTGARWAIPNGHGRDNRVDLRAAGSWAVDPPGGHLAAALGLEARSEAGQVHLLAENCHLSAGWRLLQLDLGWRDRWYGAPGDGALLMSTQAQNAPSISLGNTLPWSPLRIRGETFVALLEKMSSIEHEGRLSSGRPLLIGMTLALSPFPGGEISLARCFQTAGGRRPGFTLRRFWDAFFRPADADNAFPGGVPSDEEFGNQLASASAVLHLPWVGARLDATYGAEDTNGNSNTRIGTRAKILGLQWPFRRGRLLLQRSFHRDRWYAHVLYRDGYINQGYGLGHWMRDTRAPGDSHGGYTHTASVRQEFGRATIVEAHFRNVELRRTSGSSQLDPIPYVLGYEIGGSVSQPLDRAGTWRVAVDVAGGRTPLDRGFGLASVSLTR